MTEMLTAKEMQTLLQVDRSTIYRMAESGRLPAMKVGKQWRFPADQVESWFRGQIAPPVTNGVIRTIAGAEGKEHDFAAILPLECVQLIQGTFAELLGVMLVVTDIDGVPITRPSNPCGLFEAVSQEPDALQRCIESWHTLATTIDLEPRFTRSHLGLLCARAMIRVGTELRGMVIAGCVAPTVWPPSPDEVQRIADDLGLQKELLTPHLEAVLYLDQGQRDRVLAYLQRIANIVAHIVNERKTLVSRLAAIADLTTL